MTSQSPNASALHERGGSPQLRQQRLNGGSRPDTIEEGQAFSFGLKTARRSSSFMTDSSFEDARNSMRASTEDLFMPRSTGRDHEHQQEPSLWFSLPLLFAIVPAVVGVAFKKGSIFITDLALRKRRSHPHLKTCRPNDPSHSHTSCNLPQLVFDHSLVGTITFTLFGLTLL